MCYCFIAKKAWIRKKSNLFLQCTKIYDAKLACQLVEHDDWMIKICLKSVVDPDDTVFVTLVYKKLNNYL